MSFNPYHPPASGDTDTDGTDAAVSNRVVEALRKTRPWVSLVAISGFVAAGLSMLLGLVAFVSAEELSGVIGVAYLAWGGITLGAAITLHRFARAIGRLLHGGGMAELEDAIEAQTRFWQLTGVITLISFTLMVGGVVLVILISVALGNSF